MHERRDIFFSDAYAGSYVGVARGYRTYAWRFI